VSKAFTNEEIPDAPAPARAPPRLAPGEVRYVTPEGHAALRAELAALADARAALGATPAGAERSRADELDRRAALLDATLRTLTVLGPDAAPEGRAGFGSWVTVENEAGARTTWRLVGPDEADARRGLVSVHAPVGRALLGHEVGDAVEIARPGGAVEVEVVDVRRTAPDADPS
jgi:transcription elongation factor GreB